MSKEDYQKGYSLGQSNASNESPAAGGTNQACDELGTIFNSDMNQGVKDGWVDTLGLDRDKK
jgi:hypothetical protein